MPSLVLDELALVVEELDDLPLRRGRGAYEELLQAWPLEQPVRGLLGALLDDAGEHRRERLLRFGEAIRDLLLDVDVRVELLDRLRRDLVADLGRLDHLRRDLLEPVLAQHGPLEVERDASDECDDRREDGERPRADDASFRGCGRRRAHCAILHEIAAPCHA